MAPVLGVGVAGEAGAGAAADARRAPAVGHRVDQQRDRGGGDPERLGAAREHGLGGVGRERRHRVAALARAVIGAQRVRAAHAQLPLDPVVVGRERPRSRSASPRTARRRSSPCGSPRGRSATPSRRTRACRRRGSIALLLQAASLGQDRHVAHEARVARVRRIDLALEPGEHARVAQVIARQVRARQRLAALDQQHPLARLGEHAGGHAAAGARADHDHVVVGREVVDRDRRRRRVQPLGPARPRLHGQVAEARPRVRIRVVRARRHPQHAHQRGAAGAPGSASSSPISASRSAWLQAANSLPGRRASTARATGASAARSVPSSSITTPGMRVSATAFRRLTMSLLASGGAARARCSWAVVHG